MPACRFLFAPFLLAVAELSAQAQTPAPPPCKAAPQAQFDFWVGEWDLSWTDQDGRQARGANRITKIYDGCVILEEFDGRDGTPLRGGSVSSYDASAGKWKQVWVDNQGSWLDFEATTVDGSPSFARRVPRPDGVSQQRMVFRDITRDSLTWDWEGSKDGGKTWTRHWRILYTRRK